MDGRSRLHALFALKKIPTPPHCWAEFYTKETGWVPVDASETAKDPSRREYFFGAHDENRIEFTRGRDLALAPKQNGDLLNYFIYPYAEVDGKPYDAVERSFHYQDSVASAIGFPQKGRLPVERSK